MKNTRPYLVVFLVALCLASLSCVKRDIDKISEAQDCLDASTSDTALGCMEKIDGLESASANLIRCSAYFIDQGFADTTRLASVAERISSSNGTPQDNTFAALSVMGFVAAKYTKVRNSDLSAQSFAVCEKSKSPGLIYLSSLSRISTVILDKISAFDPQNGTPPTGPEIEAELCSGQDSTMKIAIGMAAIAAYQNDCVLHQGNGKTDDAVCQQYAAALSQSQDPETVGGLLADNLCP